MAQTQQHFTITAEQARYFRARRCHLAGPGAAGRRGGRGNQLPAEEAVLRALILVRQTGRAVSRSDVAHLVPPEYLAYMAERVGEGEAAVRAGAGRLLWVLAWRGALCAGPKQGAEQTYLLREAAFPHLPWPDPLPPADEAATALARRYLAAYGPAPRSSGGHLAPEKAGPGAADHRGAAVRLAGVAAPSRGAAGGPQPGPAPGPRRSRGDGGIGPAPVIMMLS